MNPEETIADRIFKLCVLDECDGLWYDLLTAAAIIKHAMAEKDAQLAAAEARAAGLEAALIAYASDEAHVKWNPDGFWAKRGVEFVGPKESAVEAVLALLAPATEPTLISKPIGED